MTFWPMGWDGTAGAPTDGENILGDFPGLEMDRRDYGSMDPSAPQNVPTGDRSKPEMSNENEWTDARSDRLEGDGLMQMEKMGHQKTKQTRNDSDLGQSMWTKWKSSRLKEEGDCWSSLPSS